MTSDKDISYDITYMWNLKNDTNEVIYKTRTDSVNSKMNLRVTKGKGQGRRDKLGISICTLTVYKIDHQQDPLHSAGKYTQYYVITYIRKESAKEQIYVQV